VCHTCENPETQRPLEYIEDLKADLIDAKRLAVDEDGKVLLWIGASPVQNSEFKVPPSPDYS
jgi:hypothetical protein